MPVCKKIELFGRELILHQRFASDVLAVLDMDVETKQDELNILLLSISAALKENWIDLKGRKRKKVEQELSPVGLATKLSVQQILDLWNQVSELESLESGGGDGSKKK